MESSRLSAPAEAGSVNISSVRLCFAPAFSRWISPCSLLHVNLGPACPDHVLFGSSGRTSGPARPGPRAAALGSVALAYVAGPQFRVAVPIGHVDDLAPHLDFAGCFG